MRRIGAVVAPWTIASVLATVAASIAGLAAGCNDRETLLEAAAPATRMDARPDASIERPQAASPADEPTVEKAGPSRAQAAVGDGPSQEAPDAETFVAAGDLALDHHHPADALAAYERAIAIDPDDGWAFVRASDALRALGRPEQARSRLQAFATAHTDAIPDVYEALGWLDLDLHAPARAKMDFVKALQRTHDADADAWYGLAVVAADADNGADAAQALRHVFSLDPNRRAEALKDEAFESVRGTPEWRSLFSPSK